MTLRRRLVQGATAALYMGPLLAGLAGFGWALLPPFLSVFLLWLMILRPHQWPQANADWLRGATWVTVLAQVASQALLVSVLFAIGRGIGGVLGHLPLFHPALPVAISFVAIPMSRLFWNSEKALQEGLTIDEVLYPASRPAPQAATIPALSPDRAVQPLLAMDDDAPLAEVGPALEETLDHGDAWSRLAALSEAMEAAPARHRALREALVIWTTDPETFAAGAAPTAMAITFRLAADDSRLLSRLLPRAAALARAVPGRQSQFPARAELERLRGLGLPAQPAEDLESLFSALGYADPRAAREGRPGLPFAARKTTVA